MPPSSSFYFLAQSFVVLPPVQQIFSPLSSPEVLSKTLAEVHSDPVQYVGSILDGTCWDPATSRSSLVADAWKNIPKSSPYNEHKRKNIHSHRSGMDMTLNSSYNCFASAAPSEISPNVPLDCVARMAYPSPPVTHDSPFSDPSPRSPSSPPTQFIGSDNLYFPKESPFFSNEQLGDEYEAPTYEERDVLENRSSLSHRLETPPPSCPPPTPSIHAGGPSPPVSPSPKGTRTEQLPRAGVASCPSHSQQSAATVHVQPCPPTYQPLRRQAALQAEQRLKRHEEETEVPRANRRTVGSKAKRTDDEDYTSLSSVRPKKIRKRGVTSRVSRQVRAACDESDTESAVELDPTRHCPLCGLSFGRPSDLARHVETSTTHFELASIKAPGSSRARKTASFLCKACGAKFTRKDALKRHRETTCS